MTDEAEVEARPKGEREQLIDGIIEGNRLLQELIATISRQLLRLDEIGAPVGRSRNRIDKVANARDDWYAHFDYDVVKGLTRGTKEQQVRAERYELS